jgi:hypothetical protein
MPFWTAGGLLVDEVTQRPGQSIRRRPDAAARGGVMRGLVVIFLSSLALAALAPAGWAESAPPQPSAIERLIRQERAKRLDVRSAPVIPAPPPPALQVVVSDGFDWLDALIGATSALAVVVVVGGTATLVSRSRAAQA